MLIAPSKVLTTLFPSRQSAAAAKLRQPATDWVDEATALDEPAAALSGLSYLLLLLAIFATSLITIEFAQHSNLIATIWPSNAIILAASLRYARGPMLYPLLLVGGAAASGIAGLAAGNSPIFCSTLFAANIVEVATALILLKLVRIQESNLSSLRNLIIFIAIAGVAPIASTLIATMGFHRVHEIPWAVVARNWYSGHALGMIIVVPFLISATSKERHAWRIRERPSEAAAILAIFIAIGIFVIFFRPFVFLLAPAILLATLRFGIIGATTSTFLVAVIASLYAVLGIGHPMIAHADISTRIFTLQMFLAITSFWSLPTAALLTERERLLGDLSHANAQLSADSESKSHLVTGLRRHLSMAEENERLRLSHELHDQAGQSLIAAILELNEIEDTSNAGAARERLHLVRKRMEEMGKTLHRIAWELRPPSIDELGLRKALASYIAEWGEQCGTEVDFHCDDPNLDEVPNEIATAIYRVVQEGLTNIVKHAQRPSDVSVVIRRPDATLQVIIEDSGCGFDVGARAAKAGNHRGLGLDGMRERLALIGGTLDVESAPGAGTTIFARISLDGQRSAA